MNRRSYIGTAVGIGMMGVGYAATGALDGRPEPEPLSLFGPEPRWVSDEYDDFGTYEEFTATIQNTREAGNVLVDLYLVDRYIWDPNQLNEETIENDDDFEKIATQKVYFDADERRDVVFRERRPEDNDAGWFYFWVKPTTRGAVIRNNGASGNVRVMLLEGEEGNEEQIDEQTAHIGSDETKRFTFRSDSFSTEKGWAVKTEPAD